MSKPLDVPARSEAVAGGMIAGGTFINDKAGMRGVNKEEVARVVFEMSKNSKYYVNEARKADQTDKRIELMHKRLAEEPYSETGNLSMAVTEDTCHSGSAGRERENCRDRTKTRPQPPLAPHRHGCVLCRR